MIKNILKKLKNIYKREIITYANITYTAIDTSLCGRRILITGGSSGIGRALAIKCINSGAKVVIVGRNEENLIATQEELGENCKYIVCDISKINENTDLIEKANEILGEKVDTLVNNAGIYLYSGFENIKIEDFDIVFNSNLRGVYFLTQVFIKYSLKNDITTNIIMISSNRGLMGDTNPYGMAKMGLISYTQGLAKRYRKEGIRVNAVCPGVTATGINNKDPNGNLSFGENERILQAEEIAEVCKFLISDISKCIVGDVITCDMGVSLK